MWRGIGKRTKQPQSEAQFLPEASDQASLENRRVRITAGLFRLMEETVEYPDFPNLEADISAYLRRTSEAKTFVELKKIDLELRGFLETLFKRIPE